MPILNVDIVVVVLVIGGGVVISVTFKCNNKMIFFIKDADSFRIEHYLAVVLHNFVGWPDPNSSFHPIFNFSARLGSEKRGKD